MNGSKYIETIKVLSSVAINDSTCKNCIFKENCPRTSCVIRNAATLMDCLYRNCNRLVDDLARLRVKNTKLETLLTSMDEGLTVKFRDEIREQLYDESEEEEGDPE